jgi:chitosanase
MSYKDEDKTKAAAIVNIFETGKAAGRFDAVAVLNDGAGISYGIAQFTHRSGSLGAVLDRYLQMGAPIEGETLRKYRPQWTSRTAKAIGELSKAADLKTALARAAAAAEMRAAQAEVAFKAYMQPALRECEKRGFTLPLSLAVVLDSFIHGSWEKIAGRVKAKNEKEWITEYLRKRDAWLNGSSLLRKTRYRTRFFLTEIDRRNWELKLPLVVMSVLLGTSALHDPGLIAAATGKTIDPVQPNLFEDLAAGAPHDPAETPPKNPSEPSETNASEDTRPPDKFSFGFEDVEDAVYAAAEKYDRVERVFRTVIERNDSAKSLWTTVAGTIWQTIWGAVGFLTGMPREIWLAVAIIAGALTLGYLYRQIILGRIRELRER